MIKDLKYYVDENGNIYYGDALNNNREATEEEIAEYLANIEASKPVRELNKLAIVDAFIKLGKIHDALSAINYNEVTKIRWDAASSIYANDADLNTICQATGITVRDLINVIDGKSPVDEGNNGG